MPFENKVCLQKQYPRVFTNQIDFDLFVVSFISRDHQVLQDLEGLMQFQWVVYIFVYCMFYFL